MSVKPLPLKEYRQPGCSSGLNAREFLIRLSCDVEVAGNGIEAVAQTMDGEFAMILMDCLMPEMNGYEATQEIRRLEQPGQHVPIIAVTASAMTTDRKRCFDSGMDDYLSKPFRKADLERILKRWAQPVTNPG